MEENSTSKPVILFGKDIRKIPCLRKSFLYGITGGLGCGILYFLLTSHGRKSAHIAMGSYSVITLSYWFYCRYQYTMMEINARAFRKTMRDAALLEGSEKVPIITPPDEVLESV